MTAHVTTGARLTTGHEPRVSAWLAPTEYLPITELFSAEVREVKDGTVTVYSGLSMAAARLSLRGKGWTESDRADCASDITAMVLDRRTAPTGTPREVLRYIDWCESHPLTARRYSLEAGPESAIRRADVTMTRLMGMAANWRRGVERRRATETRAHTAASFTPTVQGEQTGDYEPTETAARTAGARRVKSNIDMARIAAMPRRADRVSAWIDAVMAMNTREVQTAEVDRAHVTARRCLASLGLPSMGKAYAAAHAAALSADGLTGDDMAAAMNAPRKTAEKRVMRARFAIPSAAHPRMDYMAHADIMGVTAETETVQHGVKVSDGDWRESDRTAECTCRATETAAAAPLECEVHPLTMREYREPTAAAWTGDTAADWTRTLPASTRARLHTAAKLTRDRAARR